MGHLIPELGLNIAHHPDFPPDTKKSETPLVTLSFPNQKDANNTPRFAGYIYYQDRNGRYPQVSPLWVEHPKLLGAVVVPLELGLQLTHLFPDLDQVEGAHDALRVALTLGQPDVL